MKTNKIEKKLDPRLKRFYNFLEHDFIRTITRNNGYYFAHFNDELLSKIRNRHFKSIVFAGMGCSGIICSMLKGFLIHEGVDTKIEVVNDYNMDYCFNKIHLKENTTLVIINSYSGCTPEMLLAYDRIKNLTKDIVLITLGGELGRKGEKDGASIIKWDLKQIDQEYHIMRAPEYFNILIKIFHDFGLLETDYNKELQEAQEYVRKTFSKEHMNNAIDIAFKLIDSEITLLGSSKWTFILLKLVNLFFNEIALVPCHTASFHEFTHGEIGKFTAPVNRQGVLLFRDINEDILTMNKMNTVLELLLSEENEKVSVSLIDIYDNDFFKQLYFTLYFSCYIIFILAIHYNTSTRDLISSAIHNPWYRSQLLLQSPE